MMEWKVQIAATLNSKRQKLNQSSFQIFDENWLLIHNYRPLTNDAFTQQKAEQHLNELFLEASNHKHDFDVKFVHSGHFLFRWKTGELSSAYSPIASHGK